MVRHLSFSSLSSGLDLLRMGLSGDSAPEPNLMVLSQLPPVLFLMVALSLSPLHPKRAGHILFLLCWLVFWVINHIFYYLLQK